MDDNFLFDEPLTDPDGFKTIGWPVIDPATAKLAAADEPEQATDHQVRTAN
jgi:hypothetical protein